MNSLQKALNILAPYTCVNCGAEGDYVCDTCLPEVIDSTMVPSRCFLCKKQTDNSETCRTCRKQTPLQHVWVGTVNKGIAKQMVYQTKFGPDRTVGYQLADWLHETMSVIEADVVTWVPTAPQRVRQRAFDHAQVISRTFAQKRALPHGRLLVRSGSQRQVGAARDKRKTQVVGSYLPATDEIRGLRVLLIDDVITTGASMTEAARVLRRAGARSVDALVFAQTV